MSTIRVRVGERTTATWRAAAAAPCRAPPAAGCRRRRLRSERASVAAASLAGSLAKLSSARGRRSRSRRRGRRAGRCRGWSRSRSRRRRAGGRRSCRRRRACPVTDADPGGADLRLQREEVGPEPAEEAVVEGGRAEGRVAAALQVEAAVQDAVGSSAAGAEHLGRDPGFRPEPAERGRGREQLHVRGERSRRPRGSPADDLSAARHRPRAARSRLRPRVRAAPSGLDRTARRWPPARPRSARKNRANRGE